jgi:hypothetical protein
MRRIAYGLALAAVLLAGVAAAQPSRVEDTGTIRGRIVREGGSAAGLPVVLYAISEAGEPGVARSVSDDRGHFVFADVSNDPDTVYLVGARVHEVPFGTRASFAAGQEELEVELRVAGFDTDTSVVRSGHSTLRIDRGCAELRVREVHELHNPTDRVIHLREAERAGREPLFRAEIPALAHDLAVPPGTLPESVEREAEELRFWGPLHPGRHTLEFSYALPGEAGRLELERSFAREVPQLVFLTHRNGPQVRGSRLRPAGERSVEGRTYRAVEVRGLAAGESLAYAVVVPPVPEAPLSLVHSKIWLELDDAALVAEEQLVLRVEGDQPLVAESDAPLLCLALPAAAGGLRFSPASMAIGLDHVASGSLAIRGPVPPGDSTLAMGYRIPVAGGALRLERRFPRALPLLSIVVADTGILAETTRLHRLRSIRSEDRTYLRLEGFEIGPEESIAIDLRQLPARRPLPRFATTGFAALVAAGAIAFLIAPLRAGREPEQSGETRATRLAAEREVVYASIRDLDEDFETGKLTSQDHAALRKELRAQAVRLLQAEREAAPLPAPEAAGCPSCGSDLPRDARFCPGCGVKLAEPEGAA